MKMERDRFSHLWNALKYSSSIFPLLLSAYQQTIPKRAAAEFENLLILLMIINSAFLLYWDVVMDWGMRQGNPLGVAFCETGSKKGGSHGAHHHQNPHKAPTPCVHSILRPRLRFGLAMSGLISGIDVILRFSWTLCFTKARIFLDNDSFVLCTQFLEVFRHASWNLLRVEWENIKHSKHSMNSMLQSPPPPPPLSRGLSSHRHHYQRSSDKQPAIVLERP
jgi:hypothetical protein